MTSDPANKLLELFREFPGIGPRQARRFVYHLYTLSPTQITELTENISELRRTIRQCIECFRYFTLGKEVCDLCADTRRNNTSLLVVARDSDLEAVRRAKNYTGKFFVLGGLAPMFAKDADEALRIRELTARLKRDGEAQLLREVVFALSANTEGDYTTRMVIEKLRSISEPLNIKMSMLGRGLSTGLELEYTDPDTIEEALKHRS